MDFIEQSLRNFLNLHWLRPEVALWRTLDVIQLKKIKFANPIIDLGCGDGTFSYTNFGGKTGTEFDVFRTISNTEKFFAGKDIHDQISNVKPTIIKKPKQMIDVGVDWKKSLLDKAKKLHFYKKTMVHDLNKSLPFEDESFETLFSNIFYWIPKIENLLKDSKRVIRKSGKIIILLPDKNLKENLIYNQYMKHGFEWAKKLDRGIYKNITKHAYTYSEWKKIFSNVDLKIETHSQYLSPQLINFWNIGMRPYSPYLIEMANKLSISERKKMKKRVVKEISPILRSYIDTELKIPAYKNCFHLFVLKK